MEGDGRPHRGARTAARTAARSRATTWIASAVIILIAVAAVVIVKLVFEPAKAGDGETCGEPSTAEFVDVASPGVLMPGPEELVNFVWVFDQQDTVHRVTSLFRWQAPAFRPEPLEVNDQLAIRPKSLSNQSRTEAIPAGQMTANAVVTGDGVLLSVCVDTTGAKADRYTTALVFQDKEVQAAPFAVDVTVQHRDAWVPIAAVIVGIAVALVLLVLSLASTMNPKPAEAIVAIVLAAVLTLVVGAKPWAAAQDNPNWGQDRLDWVALAAATALAFMGAVATNDSLKGVVRATTFGDGDDDTSPPDESNGSNGSGGSGGPGGSDGEEPTPDAPASSDGGLDEPLAGEPVADDPADVREGVASPTRGSS